MRRKEEMRPGAGHCYALPYEYVSKGLRTLLISCLLGNDGGLGWFPRQCNPTITAVTQELHYYVISGDSSHEPMLRVPSPRHSRQHKGLIGEDLCNFSSIHWPNLTRRKSDLRAPP